MAQPITQNEALLKRIVIILGVLLVLGTVGLILALILRPTDRSDVASEIPSIGVLPVDGTLPLPPLAGREIVDTTIEGTTLLLRLQDSEGTQEIWVIDIATGDIIRKFSFAPDP